MSYLPILFGFAMAVHPDDMDYDAFKPLCDGLVCRPLSSPVVTVEQHPGGFTPANFPACACSANDNAGVHFFDVVRDVREPINFLEVERMYKHACEAEDVGILPPPFGLKEKVPGSIKFQFVIVTYEDGSHTIWKHFMFANKLRPNLFMQYAFGEAQRPLFMNRDPRLARKILQYCLERMGGRLFKCAELTSQAVNLKVKPVPFEDKDDEDIDKGFDYIQRFGPRSAVEMQQLRWLTKALKNKDSPIYGWPQVLVEKALRNLSSDGVLAKKQFSWPIPLTPQYYNLWVLEILEKIWDFDMSVSW